MKTITKRRHRLILDRIERISTFSRVRAHSHVRWSWIELKELVHKYSSWCFPPFCWSWIELKASYRSGNSSPRRSWSWIELKVFDFWVWDMCPQYICWSWIELKVAKPSLFRYLGTRSLILDRIESFLSRISLPVPFVLLILDRIERLTFWYTDTISYLLVDLG